MSRINFAVIVAVGFAVLAPQAHAIEVLEAGSATGICQAALPSFEGALRKRPTGILNQGPGNAFVSCAFAQNNYDDTPAERVGITLTNRTDTGMTITCTLVDGQNNFIAIPPNLLTKSFAVPAHSSSEEQWSVTGDNGNQPFDRYLGLSCNLPAGAEIGTIWYYIAEDGTAPANP